MLENKLYLRKIKEEGDLNYTYLPLQNLRKKITDYSGKTEFVLENFQTDKLPIDIKSPVSIISSPSYDGSVDLLVSSENTNPKLINSQFATLDGGKFKYISRNQSNSTNIYDDSSFELETNLFLVTNIFPKISLQNIGSGGNLSGGMYTFYIKYADEDGNESDIVSESGPVAVFHGSNPFNIEGTLLDERTNKCITLYVDNLDIRFSKYYLYFTRNTSDLNGVTLDKTYKLSEPYDTTTRKVVITGYENIVEISRDTLNITYNYYSSAKTATQVQNMLFFGNVGNSTINNSDLQKLSYFVHAEPSQDINIGYVESNYTVNNQYSFLDNEYYNPKNIYNYVGYWPTEYYCFGICYILKSGEVTRAFKLRGIDFTVQSYNYIPVTSLEELDDSIKNLFTEEEILNKNTRENTGGVFKMPDVEVIQHQNKAVKPLGIKFTIPEPVKDKLKSLGIVGYFFTRQTRIPNIIAQGLSIGIEKNTNIPVLYDYKYGNSKYVAESFIDNNGGFGEEYIEHRLDVEAVSYSGLLCLDASVNKDIQSMFINTEYRLQKEYQGQLVVNDRLYSSTDYVKANGVVDASIIYVPSNIPSMYIKDHGYSTRQGVPEAVNGFGYLGSNEDLSINNHKIVRGRYAPFLGTDVKLDPSAIYSIKLKSDITDTQKVQQLINNKHPYHTISDRYLLDNDSTHIVYRGDCFTNTVTIRLNYNFIDPTTPTNDVIVSDKKWEELLRDVEGELLKDKADATYSDVNWNEVNLGDMNALKLGVWVTYKCLSNYNLGLRSENTQNYDALSKIGIPNTFYPYSGLNIKAGGKSEESWLLNEGYNRILPRKIYIGYEPIPYDLDEFHNRIAFSNIKTSKLFANGYRVFQGLSYQDIDSSFGGIVKLLPFSQNLFCVFEHGCAIVPVNQKALLSTQEGQSIHIYGADVLQEQVSVISPDYGSIWQDSVIKTPDAYYGVDTYAKKIWKFNNEGFQIISDQKLNTFLNQNINFSEQEKYPILGVTNVKTHYNNFKGDVIFTFYHKDVCWSLHYNERMKIWTGRHSWTPLLSTNIDNIYYSMDNTLWSAYMKLNAQDNLTMSYDKVIQRNDIVYNYGNYEFSKGDYYKFKYDSLLEDLTIKLLNSSQGNIEYTPNEFTIYTIEYNGVPIEFISYTVEGKEFYITPSGDLWFEKQFSSIENKYYWVDITGSQYENIDDIIQNNLSVEYFEPEIISQNNNTMLSIFISDTKFWNDDDIILQKLQVLAYISGVKQLDKTENNPFNGDLHIYSYVSNTAEDSDALITLNIMVSQNGDYIFTDSINFIPKRLYTPVATLYKHGQAGIYNNTTLDGEILPTKWYGKQHPFEFEFIVNQPVGLHKIFDNLVILSNNVEPNSLEFEIEGDVYNFKENGLFDKIDLRKVSLVSDSTKYCETSIVQDSITKHYHLKTHQDCVNVKDFGRRLGNIQYLEDSWKLVITPIYYKFGSKNLSTKIRDKYIRIRVKYTGEKLTTINAIHTLMTISYA